MADHTYSPLLQAAIDFNNAAQGTGVLESIAPVRRAFEVLVVAIHDQRMKEIAPSKEAPEPPK
jgi:hypothetical protein